MKSLNERSSEVLNAVFTGALSAAAVSGICVVQARLSGSPHFSYFILALAAVAVVAIAVKRVFRRLHVSLGAYHGISDMLIQIHSPSNADFATRWLWKGLISFSLSCLTGTVGPEGAAIEWSYAVAMLTRPRSARWFEQRRRTDISCAISAGISAAFGAPFASVLVPIELGIGGRTLTTVVYSLAAFLGMQVAIAHFGVPRFDLSGTLDAVNLTEWPSWIALSALALVGGLVGPAFLRLIRFSRKGIMTFSPVWLGTETALAAFALILIGLVFPAGFLSNREILQKVFLMQIPIAASGILFFAKAFAFILLITGFGTTGIFWPIFALGGLLGFGFHHLLIQLPVIAGLPGIVELAPVLALAGSASLWGSILGAPISAGVLILELTGSAGTAVVCLLTAYVAHLIARKFAIPFPAQELQAKGIRLADGRSLAILEAISVKDIMVTDFETIDEKESLASLPSKLLSSRYPFLPVVRDKNSYVGLVTIDMVKDRLGHAHLEPAVSDLFEVKDLLYKSGFKTPALKTTDFLSATVKILREIPCVPVIDAEGRIQGLLFVHHVRLAYDREVARRSLEVESAALASQV